MNLDAQQSNTVCIDGYTLTSTGESTANASITATLIASGVAGSANSEPNGKFEICGLAPGIYDVIARHDQLVSRTQREDLSSGQHVSIRIAFEPAERSDAASTSSLITPGVKPASPDVNSINRPGLPEGQHVQEVHILSEFAPSGSANIPNAPSSSNRNQPHGLLYGYLGSSLVNQMEVIQRAYVPLSQYGGQLGGAIGGGNSSYFVSFDRYGINRQMLLSELAQQVVIGGGTSAGDPNVLVSSEFVSRVDHKFSSRDSGYAQFNRSEMHGNSVKTGQDSRLPELATGLNLVQESATAANTVNLSPTTTNQTKAQFISTEVQVPGGMDTVGLDATVPTARHSRVFQAADNIYRQVGAQSLRAGGDFRYNQMNISFMQSSLGRVAASGPSLSQSDRDAGLYVQSQRQLRPNLLLTSGIRYDAELMRGRSADLNNFSPQVGFAWSPGSSRTVIRGGIGMYYDRVPLPTFFGSADPAVPSNLTSSVAINNPGSNSLGQLATFTTSSPTIQNSYAEHVSLQAEQQIGNHSVLSAEYQYVRGVQLALPVRRIVSLCASTACNGGNEFTGQQVGTGATSSYNGFSVAFTQEPVRWGNYKVSYTYSTAEGSGTGANTSYIDDQMRRVSFTGVLHTSLDPGSTLWQRATHGFMLAGTTDYYNRSEFAGMNFINFNARLSKNLLVGPIFHLEAVVETFNMLERTNAAFINAAAELGESATQILSTYKNVASAQAPNGSQIGLRMTF
jgi:Carboxypeptidase regulatory-like domain